MSFAFRAANSAAGSGVTSLDCNLPAGVQPGDFLVIAYAFEGVAANSGPWITPNVGQFNPDGIGPAKSWLQVCWQDPSGTGSGLEVWVAILGTGNHIKANFAVAQNVTAVIAAYTGEYNPAGTIIAATTRLAPSQRVTGNQPPAPAVSANIGELVIAVGADQMGGAGFGSPAGFSNRVDATRAGAGTVEATIADLTASVAGSTGPITFPGNAAAVGTLGTTATLVIVPAPTTAGAGPLFDAPLPADLDLADNWTVRITALDPVTGALVPGVTVSDLALEIVDVNQSGGDVLGFGDFLLVPGPSA